MSEQVLQIISKTKTYFLISLIANSVFALAWIIIVIFGGAATCGIGCLLFFMPLFNLQGIFWDYLAYNRLQKMNTPKWVYRTAKRAARAQIAMIITGNIISFVLGITNLSNLGDPKVKYYFESRGL